MWFLLFIRQFPVIAIAEVKEIVAPRVRTQHEHGIDVTGLHLDYERETPGEKE
jgi:hypothetical protein